MNLVTLGLGSGFLLTGGLGHTASPPPGPVETEPNPDETAWTLGVGGAVVSPSIGPGFALTLATTILNAGAIVPFTSSATLDASVWRGSGEVVLIIPTVAWIDATAATLTLAISAVQSAGLEPGKYRLNVGVTASGVRMLVYDGTLEVVDGPGAGTAGLAWCDYADMLPYSDAIRSLLAAKGVDKTAFLGQRVLATSLRSYQIWKRFRHRPGMTRVRQDPPDPRLGDDVPIAAAVPLSRTQLKTALDTPGGIALDAPLREIIARDSIALVLGRQATLGNNQAYRQEAMDQKALADEIFKCYHAQIHLASPIAQPSPMPAVSDFLIHMDAILLPPGTSP